MAGGATDGAGHQLVVGVVGPSDVVTKVVDVGATMPEGAAGADFRLTPVTYADEHEVADDLRRAQSELDVCLFAGPLPYDLARAAGAITLPSTFIPVSGAPLYVTLLRAALDHGYDVRRLSVDSLGRQELEEAYAEAGLPADDVHVMAYSDPASSEAFAAFHTELYRSGATTVALTHVRSVAQQLEGAGVPVLLSRPTPATIRSTLRTAVLLGLGSRLEESRIAMGIVEVPNGGREGDFGAVRMALHGLLMDEAHRMGATVLPRNESSYYVITTLGSLVAATDDFAAPPFVERIRAELGMTVGLGIGLGDTARDAEANARTALAQARPDDGSASYLVGHEGHVLLLPSAARARRAVRDEARARAVGTLSRLVTALRAVEDHPPGAPVIVDAPRVAELLDVTPRAARRLLGTLGELNLAWQLPPTRTSGRGRPRQAYRLMVEKLD